MKLWPKRPYRPAARMAKANHTSMVPEARRALAAVAARCGEWVGPDPRAYYTKPQYRCEVYNLNLLVPCEHMVERGAAVPKRARWWQ